MGFNYRYVAWAAILAALLELPLWVLSLVRGYLMGAQDVSTTVLDLPYQVGMVVFALVAILLFAGYFVLARDAGLPFLRTMAAITGAYLVLTTLLVVVDFLMPAPSIFNSMLAAVIISVVSGVLLLLFGIALLKLRRTYSVAYPLAILFIIDGAFAITVILALLDPFVSTAIHILEAILFFRVAAAVPKPL